MRLRVDSSHLFRHYRDLIKLLTNAFATIIFLVLYTRILGHLVYLAVDPGVGLHALSDPSPVLHAADALLLVVATTFRCTSRGA